MMLNKLGVEGNRTGSIEAFRGFKKPFELDLLALEVLIMLRRKFWCNIAAFRRYSQPAVANAGSKRRGFDKSMVKPALAVVVFASVLSHVSNQQNLNAELDRRYELKISILKKLIERAKQGDRDIDVNEELKLVNKLFARVSGSKTIDFEDEAARVRKYSESRPYTEEMIIKSLNGSTEENEDESLEDVWKGLLDGLDGKKPVTQPLPTESSPHEREQIVVNKKMLDELARKEAELLNYTPSTDAHTLVANPGELSAAAKDTEVTKFL